MYIQYIPYMEVIAIVTGYDDTVLSQFIHVFVGIGINLL